MNTKVLTKCLEELSKETPNIDKVIGMLETIIEMSGQIFQPSAYPSFVPNNPNQLPPINSNTIIANPADNITEQEGSGLLAMYENGLPAKLQ